MKNFLNLLKSAGEKWLGGLRGAKCFFGHVSDRFSGPFSRFSNPFFAANQIFFRGQFRSADVLP